MSGYLWPGESLYACHSNLERLESLEPGGGLRGDLSTALILVFCSGVWAPRGGPIALDEFVSLAGRPAGAGVWWESSCFDWKKSPMFCWTWGACFVVLANGFFWEVGVTCVETLDLLRGRCLIAFLESSLDPATVLVVSDLAGVGESFAGVILQD